MYAFKKNVSQKHQFMKPILFAFFFLIASFLINSSVEAAGATPAKVTGVKITHTSGVNKLTWKTAKNAKKYEIYRASSKSGKYKKIATTTSKSYKETHSGMSYYKVRAVNGTKKGSFSSPVAMYGCKGWIISRSNGGWVSSGSIFSIMISNPGNSKMTFDGEIKKDQYRIYPVGIENRATKKVIDPSTYLDYMPINGCSKGLLSDASGGTNISKCFIPAKKTAYICVNAFSMIPSYVSAYDDTTKYCYHIGARFTVGSEAFLMEVTSDSTNYSIVPCK